MARGQLLRNFFDSSLDLFCIANFEGYFLHLNSSFKRTLGYELKELQTDPFIEFVHPDDRAATLAEMEKLSQGALTINFENRYRCKDGSYKWLSWMSMPEPADGIIYAVAREITEQKARWEQARRELGEQFAQREETEDLLKLFMENAPTAIAMFDRDMRYLMASRRWIDEYQLGDRDIIGRSHYEVFPEISEEWQEIHRRCLAGAVERRDADEFRRADGRTDWVHWEIRPWYNRHDEIGGIIMFTDLITEEKRLRDQLQQAQRLEAVGSLAGGIAHDFNNLLTIIQGRTAFALDLVGSDHRARREIEIVAQTAERAAALTKQLLAFSRQRPMEAKLLDVNEVVSDLERMWHRLLGENIEVQSVLASRLWPIFSDRSQLEQVLMNLVINARDAMPDGGKLTIETTNATLDEEYARKHIDVAPGQYVLLAVSDTGHGMDENTRLKIFDPFFTTKEPGKGTGLGLATVYGVVRQNGGNIWVYSELNKGTTFKIYLPRARTNEVDAVEEAAQISPRPQETETILLVEDEEALRELASEVLVATGYKVIEASHGARALQVAEEHQGRIHLLITDLVMPEMGGGELADLLTEQYPDLKILYMSGYTEHSSMRNGSVKPGRSFLQKPFTPDGLKRKIREVLDA